MLAQLTETLRDLVHRADEPAVAALGDERLRIGVVSADREEPRDALDDVGVRLAEEARGHHGVAEARRIAPCLGAGAVERGLALAQLVVRRAERVHLGRVARRERGEPRLHRAAEHQRRVRLLHRPGERLLVAQAIRRAVVVEALLRPRADDDLDLLREQREALLRVEERKAVRVVLALVPPRAHPDLDAAAGDVIDGDGHPGEDARVAERRGRDHRAEADPLRDRREPGERRPRVVRVRVRPDDRRVVVGAEEALEPVLLGEASETHPVVPGDALLPFDHQADARIRPAISSGSVTGARQTNRSQT